MRVLGDGAKCCGKPAECDICTVDEPTRLQVELDAEVVDEEVEGDE